MHRNFKRQQCTVAYFVRGNCVSRDIKIEKSRKKFIRPGGHGVGEYVMENQMEK